MRVIETADLGPNPALNPDETSWVYNGLDCCVTLEIRDKLIGYLEAEPDNVKETYATAMRKLAPVLYMATTGIRTDTPEKLRVLRELKKELAELNINFDKIMNGVFGWTINWRSPVQLSNFFYGVLGMRAVRKRNAKGQFNPTTNEKAMEKFCENHYVQVFARYILAMRKVGKRISFLETEIDPDGYMRTSFNIAGTDTGRFSSAFSSFGTGTNLQNVEDLLRRPFIPDDGYIFVNVDLEQADARNVGARIYQIFYDESDKAADYLNACESGDLHTTVCSMAWQELSWPDPWILTDARAVAESPFVGEWSYRDAAKRLGHGTNYFGTPPTMAVHTKTAVPIIENFQRRYFRAFPLIGNYEKKLDQQDWHSWVFNQLRDPGHLTNLFGRRRIFWDRYNDLNTLRAAIAYDPQSSTGEFLDRGWLNLWDNMPEARLHIPVHDSILFSVPIEGHTELIPQALELLKVTIELKGGRLYSIPLEAKVGFNWGSSNFDKKTNTWDNPYGLRKWTGVEEREPPKRSKSVFGI